MYHQRFIGGARSEQVSKGSNDVSTWYVTAYGVAIIGGTGEIAFHDGKMTVMKKPSKALPSKMPAL